MLRGALVRPAIWCAGAGVFAPSFRRASGSDFFFALCFRAGVGSGRAVGAVGVTVRAGHGQGVSSVHL